MAYLIDLDISSGIYEGADRKLVPQQFLRRIENVRLTRDARLEVRPEYVALGMDTYNEETLIATDIINYDEKLLAIGSDFSDFIGPTGIFEYTDSGAEEWKCALGENFYIPYVTNVRETGSLISQSSACTNIQVAVRDSVAMACYNTVDNAGFIHVYDVRSDTIFLSYDLTDLPTTDCNRELRAIVTTDGKFWTIGKSADGLSIGGFAIDPDNDTSPNTNDTKFITLGGPATIDRWSVAAVTGGAGEFIIAYSTSTGGLFARRFDSAGAPAAAQFAFTGTPIPTVLDIEADSVHNNINIVYVDPADSFRVKIETVNYTTQVSAVGPTALFSGESSDALNTVSVVRNSTTPSVVVGAYLVTEDPEGTYTVVVSTSTHAEFTTSTHADRRLYSNILRIEDCTIVASILPNAANTSNFLDDVRNQMPLVSKDFEIGVILFERVYPNLTKDAITGKYYWANLFQSNNGIPLGQVTEFDILDRSRRESCTLGNLLYFAGGMPFEYDGRIATEIGFAERPRFVVAPTGNSTIPAANMTGGGEYDYVAVWQWTDAKRNLLNSAPSVITSVTLGSTDDGVSMTVSTPHSLRMADQNRTIAGSGVQVCLFRTAGTTTKTAAALTGSASVAPPSVSLGGLTFIVSVDGGGDQTVTFAGSDDTVNEVVAAINTQTTGLTASAFGEFVRVTSDTTGAASSLTVKGGTANTVLGFFNGQTSAGVFTFRKGEIFRLTKIVSLPITHVYGAPVEIDDGRSDNSLRTNSGSTFLYTESQTPVPAHHPGPADSLQAGRDRLIAGRLPLRNEWITSRLSFQNEPISFPDAGRIQYGGEGNLSITGVSVLDQTFLLWSSSKGYAITGSGPDHTGLGSYNSPQKLGHNGMNNPLSIYEIDEGLFYQRADNQLHILDRAGASKWIGFPVVDTLTAYPRITAVTQVRDQNIVAFACNNAAEDDGVIIIYDLRKNIWMVDTIGEAIASLCEYQGRLAYVEKTSGAVFLAASTPGTGTFVTYTLESNEFQGFQQLGYGAVTGIGILGEIVGACTITTSYSIDSGYNYTVADTTALTFSGTKKTFKKIVRTSRQEVDTFAFKIVITGTSNSLGLRINRVMLETEQSPNFTRLGDGSKS